MSRIFGKEHCEAAQGQLKNQKFTNDETWDDSVREITLIENMTSFLEANAGQEVDQEVLRNMAKTLSKRINVTNPGTFKDVTMENSYGVGYRSPCVSSMRSPPIQGHSVREFDEQLKALNKENFNLKLRIFFIEESIPGLSKNPDTAEVQENLFRQLVEVKVDREALRKDIEEKQKILQQAADAMTQMENKEKETEEKNQALIEELQNKIEALESELCNERMQRKDWEDEIAEPINSKNISENLTTLQRLRDVEIALKQAEEKILEYQTQNMSLDDMLQQRDHTIKEYEENILRLNNQNAEIKESLKEALGVAKQAERVVRDLRTLKSSLREENLHLCSKLNAVEEKLCREYTKIRSFGFKMHEQQETLKDMESTISVKTANTARLLERIQEYERIVTRYNYERNLATRENNFFKTIIKKLQEECANNNNIFTIEQQSAIFEPFGGHAYNNIKSNTKATTTQKRCELHHHHHHQNMSNSDYKAQQQFCVNYLNNGNNVNLHNAAVIATSTAAELRKAANSVARVSVVNYANDLHNNCETYVTCDTCNNHYPIRYAISDGKLVHKYPTSSSSNTLDGTTLKSNFSNPNVVTPQSIYAGEVLMKKEQNQNKYYSPIDGIQELYAKGFGQSL